MANLHCWEAKQCGRQPGGVRVNELGVCPAATERRLNGSNHGYNGGRSCWMVAGTFCGGKPQGTYAMKMATCADCEFYDLVRREEGKDFADHKALLLRLRN